MSSVGERLVRESRIMQALAPPVLAAARRWQRVARRGMQVARESAACTGSLGGVRAFGILLLAAVVTEVLTRMALGRPLGAWWWRAAAAGLGWWAMRAGGAWAALRRGSLAARLLGWREKAP